MALNGNSNFLKAHYDWLVALGGIVALVLAAVYFVSGLGVDAEEKADEALMKVNRLKPAETGVQKIDLTSFESTLRFIRSPGKVGEVSDRHANFLASERRVKCKCNKAIPGDVKAFPACPFCGEKQLTEKVIVLDADNDGLPDEWERKYSLNPADVADADMDSDNDGFTNKEEFASSTNPADPKDHPDYFDSLKLQLPLKETKMTVVFRRANKIPSGWRLEFFDPKRKNDYGRMGTTITALIGERVADTGFKVKGYEPKTIKEKIRGTEGLTRSIDASIAVLERESDGKIVKLEVMRGNKIVFSPIDVQAKLVYERGGKTFDVVPGSKISLHSDKYEVISVRAVGKGAEVELENVITGKTRKLMALE